MPSGVYPRTSAMLAQIRQYAGHRKGAKQSPQTVALMRQRSLEWWADPLNRAKHLGRKTSAATKRRQRLAKIRNPVRYWLGKQRPTPSEATRAKMCAVMKGRAKPIGWSPHIKRPNPYKGIIFRSTYEVRAAKAMDALGIPWVYEPQRFDLGAFRYSPDFYLLVDNAYWEIKGWFSPISQLKVAAFRAAHPETPLVVVTESCLQALESAAAKAA